MKKIFRKLILRKLKEFLKDNSAGSLLEYGLLIGFSIFIFILIIAIVTQIFEWTGGQISELFGVIG